MPHFDNHPLNTRPVFRDRPFNLKGGVVMVFCFVQNFFFGQHKSWNIFFFCRTKCEIFFPEFNIRLYDKSSESHYFFFRPPKSEYFFQQHWESEYFFRKKNHNPPFKLNGRSLTRAKNFYDKSLFVLHFYMLSIMYFEYTCR